MNLTSFHNTAKDVHGVKIDYMNDSGTKISLKFHELPNVLKSRYEDLRRVFSKLLGFNEVPAQWMCFDFKKESDNSIVVNVKYTNVISYYDAEISIKKILILKSIGDEINYLESPKAKAKAVLQNDIYRCILDLDESLMNNIGSISEIYTSQMEITFDNN